MQLYFFIFYFFYKFLDLDYFFIFLFFYKWVGGLDGWMDGLVGQPYHA